MITIIPSETPLPLFHEYMLSAISPRPIALVSTINKNGEVNVSPFSFFNAFGSNPPTLVFSPARSGRTGKTKDTLDNVKEVPECVIHIGNYNIVHQMSLASGEYDKGVNEFLKAGFTEIPSQTIRVPRVKEAPVHFECSVVNVIETGDQGGAGNLVICRIQLIHIDESVLDKDNKIDPYKMDYIGRMGKNFYTRVIPESIFEVPKPAGRDDVGIGFDQLPKDILHSGFLTGNDLAQLASIKKLPTSEEIESFKKSVDFENLKSYLVNDEELHQLASKLIRAGEISKAIFILMSK